MGALQGCRPEKVFEFFEKICSIPHGSGNTKAISDYCAGFAAERGLEYVQDSVNNIIIKKPASPGCGSGPTVILQGHLDMVCAKDPGTEFDFLTQPITPETDGEWVSARGTSLGADNGVAVAMMLALLDTPDAAHPPLEAVFTIDEEVGLDGAKALDVSLLKGKYLLNMDSEDEGVLTAGCAGGRRVDCTLAVNAEQAEGRLFTIKVDGLLGGHSGAEIDKGRANANKLLGSTLREMLTASQYRLCSVSGGFADNAIPDSAQAEILAGDSCRETFARVVEECEKRFREEFKDTDAGVTVTLADGGSVSRSAIDLEGTRKAVALICDTPNGVQRMSDDLPGLVQTSLNLGVMSTEGGQITLSFSVRSSVGTEKESVCGRLKEITGRLGGKTQMRSDYPAWEFRRESRLRDLMVECYRDICGGEMKVTAIHGGLECGVLSDKMPDLDCVSFGPDMQNVHTSQERLSIASTQRTYSFLLEILKRLSRENI